MPRRGHIVLLLWGVLLVVACNSGGSSTTNISTGTGSPVFRSVPSPISFYTPTTPSPVTPPVTPPPPPPPSTPPPGAWTVTPEYTRQPSFAVINAAGAYRRGFTGQGVTVGVLDGGAWWGAPEFDGTLAGYPVLVEVVRPPTGVSRVRRWRLSEAQARTAYNVQITRDNPGTPNNEYSALFSLGTFGGTAPTLLTDAQTRNDVYSEVGVFEGCRTAAGTFSCTTLSTSADNLGHGIGVASVVAGRRDNSWVYGVAYNAKVVMSIGGDSSNLAGLGSGSRISAYYRGRISYLARRAKIVVHSYSHIFNIAVSDSPTDPIIAATYRPLVSILEQAATPMAERTIHVYAGGNRCSVPTCNNTRAALPGLLPHYFPALRTGQVVAVVGIDQSRNLIPGYHQCGLAQNWCIAAPGAGILVPFIDPLVYARVAGSSFSAPMVAGVLALMTEAFRNSLGSHELVQRLFATANKRAPCNVPAIYGQGCVDADAATRPVGLTTVVRADGFGSFLAQGTHFVAPAAFGDSLTRSVAREEIAAFDELDAPFFMPLTRAFDTVPVERLQAFMLRGVREEFRKDTLFFSQRGVDGGFLSGLPAGDFWGQTAMPYMRLVGEESFGSGIAFLEGQMRLGVFSGTPSYLVDDIHEHSPAQGFALSYGEAEALEMNVGFLHENDRIFGGVGGGGFGENVRTEHIFWGFAKKFDLGKTHIFVGGQLGVTWVLESEGYLLHFPSGILGSSFMAGVGRDEVLTFGDRVALRISQPLRVERGRAVFSFASGRRRDGTRIGRQFEADLTPSGREIALELLYSVPVSSRATFKTSLGYYMEPGHKRDAQSEIGVMIALFAQF